MQYKLHKESFRSFFEDAAIGAAILSLDGRFIKTNKAMHETLGYSESELTDTLFKDIAHPDGSGDDQNAWHRLVSEGINIHHQEKKFIHKKGGTVWASLNTALLRDAKGKPACFTVQLQDISEQKQVEETLRKSEASLAEAQRIAHIGNWELDLVSGHLMWSDEIYRIFELDPQTFDASYTAFLEAVHPDDRDFVNKAYHESVKNKTPYNIVHRLLLTGGTLKYVNERCETLYNERGKPLRSIGTIQDITEQRRAEEALQQAHDELEKRIAERTTGLKESEERYRQLFNASNDAIFLVEITAKQLPGRFIDANIEACRRLGYSREELLKLGPRDIHDAATIGKISKRIKHLFEHKKLMHETLQITKDGRKIPTEINVHLIELNSEPVLLATARDITERKQAEKTLRELILHQETNKEALRSRIAREIHDELGQSMIALNMELNWLKRHSPGNNPALENKFIGIQKLITNTVEAVHRISADLRPVILDDRGLEPALTWYIAQFQKRSGIHCDASISLGTRQIPHHCATAIYRIVQETFTNISRHANASRVSVNISADNRHIIMVVKDNGIGIRTQEINNNASYGLLGMRERITGLQGKFDIHGEPGHGTTVTASLPLDSMAAAGKIVPSDQTYTEYSI